jgi:hypothetical protein
MYHAPKVLGKPGMCMLLVDQSVQSAHSADPAGRSVCPLCTPCWQVSLHNLQTLLVDQSAQSADLTGGPVCTVCRPHWRTSLHSLQTSLADQSAQSADLTGGPVCTVCRPHWQTSLHSLQTLLADKSAQSADPAGGQVCAVCTVCRWHSMPSNFLSCGMWDAINMGLLFFLVGSQNLWDP